MKLTILGSGTCAVTLRRSCSSYYLNADGTHILLDMGFGALRRLAEAGIDYRDIDVVIASHFHLDHISDLPPLLMALRFTPGYKRQKPLTLIGPKNLKRFLFDCRDLFGDWLLPTDEYELNIHELEAEQLLLSNCLITARSTFHTENSNGYRFECNGRSLMYSGDSGPCDALVELAEDVDLALIECSFPDDEAFEKHLTPMQAAHIAEQAHAKKLLLTHFYPSMDKINIMAACKNFYNGRISIAEDLACYELDS